jgi:hypothetical protein
MVARDAAFSEVAQQRIQSVKRKLLMVALVSAGFVVGGAVIYFSGNGFLESRQNAERNLRSEIDNLSARSTQMQQDAVEAKDAVALHEFLAPKLATNDFSLPRELLTQRMRILSERMNLVEVGVRASAVEEIENSKIKLSNGKEISMQVDLEIQAPSDAHILRFVDALPVALPGFIEIHHLELTREAELHNEVVLAIAQGIRSVTAKGKIGFIWRGIRPNPETEAPAGEQPPAAAPGPLSHKNIHPVRQGGAV